jgi:putative heme-binding domain-containing protein
LLDEDAFRSTVIPLLARFDAPNIPGALLERFERFNAVDRSTALATLTRRTASALQLLDAVSAGRMKRDQLSAFQVRQLTELKNPEVDRRVTALWGRIQQTPADKAVWIARLQKTFDEAPLWAYSASEGRNHFVRVCSQCHRIGNDGARIGPELTGAGQHGIRYFLENIIDPNAVIGADFQLTLIETRQGTSWSGLMAGETASAVSLKTLTETVVIPKTDILKRETSDRSLMPEGILESLGDRERIELLKYLVTH